MFEMAVRGETLRAIATTLNAEGVPTANGASEWSYVVISRMLRLDSYKGVAIMNRFARTRVGGRQKTTARPVDEHIELPPGTIPAIVSLDIWDAVQVRLEHNKMYAPRNNRNPEAFFSDVGSSSVAIVVSAFTPLPTNYKRHVTACICRDDPRARSRELPSPFHERPSP